MGSLFEIQGNLRGIFNELEMNGGELTPELEEALIINQENLKEKLSAYRAVIAETKMQIEAADAEIKRVQAFKKTKVNLEERLRNSCLDAVLQFGDTGKSGNKIVEFGTNKMFTRDTKSVELDKVIIDTIRESYIRLIGEYENDVEGEVEELSMDYILMYISREVNAVRALYEKEPVEITIDDLRCINVKVESEMPLLNFCSKENRVMFNYAYQNPQSTTVVDNTSKKLVGSILDMKTSDVHIGKYIINTSLTIK